MKKVFVPLLTVTILLVAATTVWAATAAKTPAEIYTNLTGTTVKEAYEQRTAENKTFGQLAEEADKLDEFKEQLLESKKSILQQKVEDGVFTQEQADAFLKVLEERIAACDGSGNGGRLGRQFGAGFGRGAGCGSGMGFGKGAGRRLR